MKHNFLTKLLILAVVVTATTVMSYGQARIIGKYQAVIPFDFTVGNETYEAGSFKITLTGVSDAVPAMFFRLEDAKGKILQSTTSIKNGSRSQNDRTSLVFNRYGDVYVLKTIVSPNFGYTVRSQGASTSVRISRTKNVKPESVAINLMPQK